MKKLLEIDESKRISAEEALKQAFFEDLLKADLDLLKNMNHNIKENI